MPPVKKQDSMTRDEAYKWFLELRQLDPDVEPCPSCNGIGRKTYGDTSTWQHRPGGQTITGGVCDKCWSSGDASNPGANLRQIYYTHEKLNRLLDETVTCAKKCIPMLDYPNKPKRLLEELLLKIEKEPKKRQVSSMRMDGKLVREVADHANDIRIKEEAFLFIPPTEFPISLMNTRAVLKAYEAYCKEQK